MNLLIILASLLVFVQAQPDKRKEIQDREDQLAKEFNSQNFSGCAMFYHPEAVIVPQEMPANFMNQTSMAGYLKDAWDHGVRNITLKTVEVFQESETLIHELGNMGGLPRKKYHPANPHAPFYTRWVKSDDDVWMIAFEAMGITSGSNQTTNSERKKAIKRRRLEAPSPSDVLSQLWQDFTSAFNEGHIDAAADVVFNPGAIVVGPPAISFIRQDNITRWLQEFYGRGGRFKKFSAFHILPESDDLWHELGMVTWQDDHVYEDSLYYYTRWFLTDSNTWNIAALIFDLAR